MSKFASERDEPRDLHGFEEVLEAARVDTLSPEDMDNYQDMLDAVKIEARKADLYDRQQAEARAVRKKQIEIALRIVKEFGQSPEKAAEMTGLQVSDFMDA